MRGPVFVLHCLIRLCCIICATGRQLLRPAMSGSRASRAKENVYKTVPKNAANESISVFETEGTKILDASSEYERASNQTLISSGNEEDNRRVLLWLQLIAATFLIVGVTIKIYVKCKRICIDDLDPEIVCYLCEKKVTLSEWNDKTNGHRNYCIVKSKDCRDLLSDMPRVDLPCRLCDDKLRIWPPNVGPPVFSCKAPLCRFGGSQIRNKGSNRLNCFRCDFDLCRECAEEEMAAIRSAKIIKNVSAHGLFRAGLDKSRRKSFNSLNVEMKGLSKDTLFPKGSLIASPGHMFGIQPSKMFEISNFNLSKTIDEIDLSISVPRQAFEMNEFVSTPHDPSVKIISNDDTTF